MKDQPRPVKPPKSTRRTKPTPRYRYLAYSQFAAELRRVFRTRWSPYGDSLTLTVADALRVARTVASRSRRQP